MTKEIKIMVRRENNETHFYAKPTDIVAIGGGGQLALVRNLIYQMDEKLVKAEWADAGGPDSPNDVKIILGDVSHIILEIDLYSLTFEEATSVLNNMVLAIQCLVFEAKRTSFEKEWVYTLEV